MPKEGELYYYLALAYKGIGNTEEAYKNFFQSTWYYEWFSSAYYELALIESKKRNYDKSLEFAEKAYSTNNYDGKINVLYSAMLRRFDEKEQAEEVIEKLLKYDPLNFAAYYEKDLITGNSTLVNWQKNMQDIDNNYLEIASVYINAGLIEEGVKLLSQVQAPKNPLVNYYLAWLYAENDQAAKSKQMIEAANKISIDYCFPYRKETETVLNYVAVNETHNSKAYYLMGNLLFDKRPDDAIAAWHNAINENEDFPMVWRNLAFGAFHHEKDVEKAIDYLKKAIEKDSHNPIWYAELENYYDVSGKDFKECLNILENNISEVKKDITAPKSLVKLYNLKGEYDKAIELLKTHHFRTWEGGRVIYYHYVDAHTLKALELMKTGKYDEAIAQLNEVMLYPENLEVGKPLNDERNAMMYFFIGQAYKAKGNKKKANEYFNKSINAKNTGRWQDLLYYQAKSNEEVGNKEEAKEIYTDLINKGKSLVENGAGRSGIGVEETTTNKKSLSDGYYLQALGTNGLGNEKEAKDLLEKSLDAYKNNLWAKFYFSELN